MDICSVSIDGHRIVYAAKGTTANPPLLLVHGWGASHKFWIPTMERLHLRFRCLAPDLPGFGLTDRPPEWDYSLAGLAGFLGRFLDTLGCGAVDAVGHSMGGATLLRFVIACPERVKKLCVVNPPLYGPEAFFAFTRFASSFPMRRISFAGLRLRPIRRWIAKDFTYVKPLPDPLLDDLAAMSYRAATEPVADMKALDLRAEVARLAVPALYVGTDKDGVIHPKQRAYWPRESYVEIRETGHIPMIERPDEFNRVLSDFLVPAPAEIPVG